MAINNTSHPNLWKIQHEEHWIKYHREAIEKGWRHQTVVWHLAAVERGKDKIKAIKLRMLIEGVDK
jgi:hypothetical protein